MSTKAIYNIISEEDYANMSNDLVKMITILMVVNILMFINNPKENKILTLVYLKLCLFILLGIVTYWLVIKNIIVFIKS
jgi:hypothetical protein|tara:strand:+ start:625 stop:861 length:237 start_codon:yes stop_codon:yes gene_type:complete